MGKQKINYPTSVHFFFGGGGKKRIINANTLVLCYKVDSAEVMYIFLKMWFGGGGVGIFLWIN